MAHEIYWREYCNARNLLTELGVFNDPLEGSRGDTIANAIRRLVREQQATSQPAATTNVPPLNT